MTQKEDTNRFIDPRAVSDSRKEIDDEIKLIDIIYLIYKRRYFLIILCLVFAIVTGVYSYFSPKIYNATAVILPVSDKSSTSITQGLASTFLEQFGMSSLLGGSSSTQSQIFGAVLTSKELAAEVLKRYNYYTMMGVSKQYEGAINKSMAGMIQVSKSTENSSLLVTVASNDPVFASDLANSYVKELDRYNLNNSFTSARYLREYIEKRLEDANRELNQAQKELREFQEKNRAVSISDQADATLKVLSQMEAQKVQLEVDLASKEKFYKGTHVQLEQLKAQIEALQKNIDRLTYSEEDSVTIEREGGKIEFYIPLNSIPGLNFDESKLLLKVTAKTGVVTLLTTQLEQTKLDEAKDIPTINVLEWAYPSGIPVKPRIKLNVALSIFAGLFIGLFIIILMAFMQRMVRDPETAPKWLEMKENFIRFFKSIRRFKW